jgi:hypothetical protein
MALDRNVLRGALLQLVPDRADRIMAWFTLTQILELRFGGFPPTLVDRILAADMGQLGIWVVRAIDAPDLQAVFDST